MNFIGIKRSCIETIKETYKLNSNAKCLISNHMYFKSVS